MDPSTVLEQYTQDLSNLPSELAYLLEELREKDLKSYDLKKKIQQRDSQIHKYIKQNSSLVRHPKEDLIYSKIKEDFDKSIKLQNEKCILANTSLFLISKHLTRLEKDIEKLEKDGVIPPIMDLADSDKDTDMLVTLPSSSSSSNSHNILQTNIESLSSQVSNASLADSGRKQPKPRTMKSRQTTPNTPTVPGSLAGSSTSSTTNLPPLSISHHGVGVNNNNSLSSPSIHGISSSSSSLGISKKRLKSDELLSDDMDLDAMFIKSSNKNKKILEHGASGTVTIPKLSSLGVVVSSHNHSNSSSVNNMNSLNNEEDELYCFCQQVSYGNMIACDNSNCKYEWFHYDCVGLKEPPQGIWYCPDCTKAMEDMNMKKKERKRK